MFEQCFIVRDRLETLVDGTFKITEVGDTLFRFLFLVLENSVMSFRIFVYYQALTFKERVF